MYSGVFSPNTYLSSSGEIYISSGVVLGKFRLGVAVACPVVAEPTAGGWPSTTMFSWNNGGG